MWEASCSAEVPGVCCRFLIECSVGFAIRRFLLLLRESNVCFSCSATPARLLQCENAPAEQLAERVSVYLLTSGIMIAGSDSSSCSECGHWVTMSVDLS